MPAPQRRVECAILGQAEIRADGIRLTPEAERQFGLALYFCANAGRELPRDDVAELLWPEHEGEASRHCLRQALYRLRAVGMPVRTGAKSLALDERCVAADYQPVISESAGAQAFLALTDVSVLPGYVPRFAPSFGRWVEDFRDDIGARLRRGLVRALVDARARGRYADVERLARHCLTLDPLNEEATLALAEAVALAGGKAEALNIIARYEREIGSRPQLCVPARILKSRVSDLSAEWTGGRLPRVPLVGRDAEIEWLLAVFADVARGSSRSVCLLGDGGIGKTALAEEFLRMASLRQAACIRVLCQASDSVRPLSAVCDILSRLLTMRGALGASPKSLETIRPLLSYQSDHTARVGEEGFQALDRQQVFDAVADVLDAVAEENPPIVFVDDVHWIDRESIRLLSRLCQRSEGRAFYLLGCGRSMIERADPWPEGDSHTQVRQIKPLSSDACRRLVSLLLVDAAPAASEERVEDLLRLAGGNPLFLIELARRVTERPYETLPENLALLLDARIQARSQLGLTVLQACAVLGKHGTLDRLERLLELPAFQLTTALNELEGNALVLADDKRLQCRHELISVAVERTLESAASLLLRKRAAKLLEGDAVASGDPALLWLAAQYWESTQQSDQAQRVFELLGSYLTAIGSASEACQAFERAIAHCSDDLDTLRILGKRLLAERAACDWSGMLATLQRRRVIRGGLSLTAEDLDKDMFLYYEALWHTNRYADQSELLATLLESSKSSASLTAQRAAIQRTMIVAINALDRRLASLMAAALTGDDEVLANQDLETLATSLIYHSDCGDLSTAIQIAELLRCRVEITQQILPNDLQKLRWSTVPLIYQGRFDESRNTLEVIYAIAKERRLWMETIDASEALCVLQLLRSEPDAARTWLQRLGDACLGTNDRLFQATFHFYAALVGFVDGSLDEASRLVECASIVVAEKKDKFARAHAQCLGLKIAIQLRRNETVLDEELNELKKLLERSLDFGGHDIAVHAAAGGLTRGGRDEERNKLLTAYTAERRERYYLPGFVTQIDSEVR